MSDIIGPPDCPSPRDPAQQDAAGLSGRDPDAILICAASEVVEGGKGVRFPVLNCGHAATGFVVRHQGVVHAYLNRCAHAPVELDWEPGRFFEGTGTYLMCASHGAIYLPESGQCVGGPCKGSRLHVLSVLERDGQVYWRADRTVTPPAG